MIVPEMARDVFMDIGEKRVNMKEKKKKSSVRDLWIPESWRYNGSGFYRNKKKMIFRKRKYKNEVTY